MPSVSKEAQLSASDLHVKHAIMLLPPHGARCASSRGWREALETHGRHMLLST